MKTKHIKRKTRRNRQTRKSGGATNTEDPLFKLGQDETGINAYKDDIDGLFHIYPRLALDYLVDMEEDDLTSSLKKLRYENTDNLKKKIDLLKIGVSTDKIYHYYEDVVYKNNDEGAVMVVDYDLSDGSKLQERKLVVKKNGTAHYFTFVDLGEMERGNDNTINAKQGNSLARRTIKRGYNYYKKAALLLSSDESRTLYKFKKEHGDRYLFELFKVDWRLAVNKLETVQDNKFELLIEPFKTCGVDESGEPLIYNCLTDMRREIKNGNISTQSRGYYYKNINKIKHLCGYEYAYDNIAAFTKLEEVHGYTLKNVYSNIGLLLTTLDQTRYYKTAYRYKQTYGKKYLIYLFLIDPKTVFEILLMYHRNNREQYYRELEILADEFILKSPGMIGDINEYVMWSNHYMSIKPIPKNKPEISDI